MKRGFVTETCVVAYCGECGNVYDPPGLRHGVQFRSVDEAVAFFACGAHGWGMVGGRLLCWMCMESADCFEPGHDWQVMTWFDTDGTLTGFHHCARCGLLGPKVQP